MEHIILLGASGHSEVIIDILHCIARKENIQYNIALLDDNESLCGHMIMGHKVIGKISECVRFHESRFIIAIGNNEIRKKIADKYLLNYKTVIHPSAIIGENVKIDIGTVVMPGAIVNSGTKIGKHCIVNTGVTIDHDNTISDFVHLSPGVHLGGSDFVGEKSWFGIGSCCINNISIGSSVIVGAGSTVIRDLKESGTYVGIPAKRIGD